MRLAVVSLVALAVAAPVAAQKMNAEIFHERATKLKGKGAMAVFSAGEIRTLMREGQAAGQSSKALYDADKKAGRPTRFCAPPGRQAMASDEFMTRLSSIPQADRRRIDMTEAMTRIFAVKFPCRV